MLAARLRALPVPPAGRWAAAVSVRPSLIASFLPGQRADFGGTECAAENAELVEIASEVVRVPTFPLASFILEPIEFGAESTQVRGDGTAGARVVESLFQR